MFFTCVHLAYFTLSNSIQPLAIYYLNIFYHSLSFPQLSFHSQKSTRKKLSHLLSDMFILFNKLLILLSGLPLAKYTLKNLSHLLSIPSLYHIFPFFYFASYS